MYYHSQRKRKNTKCGGCLLTAGFTDPHGAKPEGLTHLYGNQLTEKDNPVIVFRGKLDTLCAMILEAQLLGKENQSFADDLQEILEFTRSLLPAEYKCIPLGEFRVLGFTSQDLREQSYNPKKYFGHEHLLMHNSMGALSLRMNLLRTVTRETELSAVALLRDSSDSNRQTREDIVTALNRLSSLFYILIYKYLPKDYTPAGNAGI
jgi:ethanolamine utilization cobalamin adenosyltransferase